MSNVCAQRPVNLWHNLSAGTTLAVIFGVVALSVDAGAKALDRVKSFYASEGIKHLAVYLDADAAAIFTLKAGGVLGMLFAFGFHFRCKIILR